MTARKLLASTLFTLVLLPLLPRLVRAGDGPGDPPGFWTEDELRRIDEGLAVVNASRADLDFQKQVIDDPFRLDVVKRALDDPLSVGRTAEKWDAAVRDPDIGVVLRRALGTVSGGQMMTSNMTSSDTPVEPLPAAAARPYRLLTTRVLTQGDFVRMSLRKLEDRRGAVLRAALKSQVEMPTLALDAPEIDEAALQAAVQTVEREKLLWPADALLGDVRALVEALRSAPQDRTFTGTIRLSDEFGGIVISGYGDDVHDEGDDVAVVIDLGGNDTYTHGARACIERGRPISIVIDMEGDDRYVGGNDLSFGGALGGIAIQWDGGGNDLYQAGHCSLGAGILGVGVLVDEGGDDVFRAKDFCEGAGAFGVGLLSKKGGNDLYHADLFGQGFASTWGCGVLADLGGNDTYDAGGAHVHAPLFRDRYTSLSQGFAIGSRPSASGGVGVLVDVSGNDRYVADIYAQGSSYWFSLGLLIDDDGHDTYVAGQYSCGSGIHLSAGMLLDRAGNDSYHCLNGVGVGGAHDFAVGFLVDRGGDDHYSGSGGSQGGALTNSVAMLIDDGGDDGYCAVHGGSQGIATPARGTGGIGLLLDGGGKDVYSETTREGGVWVAGVEGAGLDEPSSSTANGEPQAASISPEEAEKQVVEKGQVEKDGAKVWDLDKLWALASEWEVNDNRVIMPIARKYLWALGAPVLDRAFERLGSGSTGSGLEFRAVELTIAEFAKTERDAIVARLITATASEDVTVKKGAISLLGTLKAEESVETLAKLLETDAAVRRQALSALAAMKQAPAAVVTALSSEKELDGVYAAACLGAVGDETSITALLGALSETTPFLVRTAATEKLAALGAAAVPGLTRVAGDTALSVTARRNALRALGNSKSADAAAPIEAALTSEDRWLRLSAYTAASALAKALDAEPAAALRKCLDGARAVETDPLLWRYVDR